MRDGTEVEGGGPRHEDVLDQQTAFLVESVMGHVVETEDEELVRLAQYFWCCLAHQAELAQNIQSQLLLFHQTEVCSF